MSVKAPPQLTLALQQLQDLYDHGKHSLDERPGPAPFGSGATQDESKQLNVRPDRLRQLRQLADPSEGYCPKEFKQLCELCETHNYALRPSLLFRLLTVPKKERLKLRRQLVQKHWSLSQLTQVIAERFGTRRQGGRRPQFPRDQVSFYAELERHCERWRRWDRERIRREKAQPGEAALRWKLPKEIRRGIDTMTKAAETLQAAVARELRKSSSGWQARQALRQP